MKTKDQVIAQMILSGAGNGNWTTPLRDTRLHLERKPDEFKQKYQVNTGTDGAVVLPFLACEPLFETIRDKGIVGLSSQHALELLGAFTDIPPADEQKLPYPDYVYAMKAFVGDFQMSLAVVGGRDAKSYSTDDDAEESLDAQSPRPVIKRPPSFVERSSGANSHSFGIE